MGFCTSCGRPRRADALFCTGCGVSFGDGADDQASAAARPAETQADDTGEGFAGLRFTTARHASGAGGGGSWRAAGQGSGRRRKIIAAALAVVVTAAGGTALALVLTRGHAQAGTPLAHTGGTGQQPATGPQAQATSPSQPVLQTPVATPSQASPSVSPAAPTAADNSVAVAPGVDTDPNASPVENLLTSYFTAINNHDYQGYVSLFDQQFQQSFSPQQFTVGYGSTADSGITLTGISTTGSGGLAATVTFTSHQQPSQSPDKASCENWTITLYLEQQGGGYVIGNPPPGYHSAHQPC